MMTKSELENKIKEANWAYWVESNPIISDFEYDKLIEDLRKIDPKNELINAFTFIGSERKVVHSKPMLSLDKAYSLEEVLKWAKKNARSENEEFIIMPKYDGLSGKFENGKLSSRGDGKIGQDYTDRLPLIKFLTKNKNKDVLLGEMLITNDDFENVYKNLKTKSGIPFKNQRNAASGIIGCDDIDFYAKQGAKITFVDYDIIKYKATIKDIETKWEQIVAAIQKLPYPMDGIVIKINDKEYYDSLGNTDHAPRGAIAFKYTNHAKWTKLIGIEWTMGKDQLACVGQVEPIDITGITIKNVKLQLTKPVASDVNSYIIDGSLQIGDYVLVERAGDIIPHVKESKPGENRQRIEVKTCPYCGSALKITDTSVECSNNNCSEKIIQRLYFAMMNLGFKGVGEAYAKNLYAKLGVNNVDKLLSVKRSDLALHDCFGTKLADNFIAEQTKVIANATFEQVLVALNIPNLGKNAAKLLTENFNYNKIVGGDITYDELRSIKGIGPIVAEDVSKNLVLKKDEVILTMNHFNFKNTKEQKKEEKVGERICFTGKMEHSRSEMEKLANDHGYISVDHIDKKTNILVCADPNSSSSKMQKAKKNGCKIISEKEFYEMIN